MDERGRFIVLEGGVGAGKDTQSEMLLRGVLQGWNYYREPGGTLYGELVRGAVQGLHGYEVHPIASLLAYSSSRANLVHTKIIPDISDGKNVLLNRYHYSTYAYQGAEGVSKLLILILAKIATGGFKPELVLHYDTDPSTGLSRKKRGVLSDIDRYDAKKLEFHEKVRRNYYELALLHPKIWVKVDASKTPQEIYNDTVEILKRKKIIPSTRG